MKTTLTNFVLIIYTFCLASCTDKDGQTEKEGLTQEENIVHDNSIGFDYLIQEEVFVPIYSEIYTKKREYFFHLTATLSIRNTSKVDTLFVKNVDYYNTNGEFIRSYLKRPVYVKPFGTLEYVIAEKDSLGGSGANFHLVWGSNKPIKPFIQGVMIGIFNQQAFAFTTLGVTISTKE
ncbi:DUF3124 domain-containing protein [Maribacter arcticus]|uniref:DUF3124 domain-containing protein n=1 Tax=Maribacter arcticus TaxID=561365 RepID=A0A1T5CG20_9FLAO|nr:DUF3124 domain-containing protein [Maribacter arcticus]SKB58283.1 Protein of unknown function [Maribacter arcticus]